MKLETEADLDDLIICHMCHTLHKEVPIKDGSKACCKTCGTVLYRYDTRLVDYGLALSITALILFVLANMFPLVKVEILGHEQFITLSKTFLNLFENGFFIVGLLCLFLIFVFPLLIIVIYLLLFTLFKTRSNSGLVKELLILLSHIKPWSMSEIFLVSILVALVKQIGYAQIHIGVSFWALMGFVMIDIYLSRNIQLSEIWMLRRRLYETRKGEG
jgi:paraquat-inducible protein A